MRLQKQRPIKYKNSQIEIVSNDEQLHHIEMMRESNRLYWAYKFLVLILGWCSRKEIVEVVEHIKFMID